ncbi:MAG TPA: aminotransferase class I/II-fold pyridoxal phosphate-dependent enzyme, partial [Bacteroidales bacterium]|nr:aminotransferase class I/II-fold pyridoxal phosphate-dependent enzyme [Bacteroidales bacterium]
NIRFGILFASHEIIAVLNKIKLPYNISGLVQSYALSVLTGDISKKDIMVKEILAERDKLIKVIQTIDGVQKVYRSDANFILVKIANAHNIYNYLVTKGIIVRDRSKIALCDDSLRITIGTPKENVLLIETLRQYTQ